MKARALSVSRVGVRCPVTGILEVREGEVTAKLRVFVYFHAKLCAACTPRLPVRGDAI